MLKLNHGALHVLAGRVVALRWLAVLWRSILRAVGLSLIPPRRDLQFLEQAPVCSGHRDQDSDWRSIRNMLRGGREGA